MNDYEVAPRKRSKCEVKKIPGQTLDFCRDIAAANSLGVSYGTYMGMKHDAEAQEYFEKFGVRMKRRRPK